MPIKRDAKWLEQLGAVEHVRELVDAKQYVEARDLLLRLRAEPRGKTSTHLNYWLAIVCDYLEEFPMALRYIEEAIAADPLAVPFHRSFDIITNRIRGWMTAEGRAADDPAIPTLYRLLAASGEANLPCHLAMARHHLACGEAERAVRLLEAVTLLEPSSAEAWAGLARAAHLAGNRELAERAQFECAALGESGVPVAFAVPGAVQA